MRLDCWTHERKHRMAKRYSTHRCNLKSWEIGVIEDIPMHQIWELEMPFFQAFSTAHPRGACLHTLHELFPGVEDCDFTLRADITINGGKVGPHDVVCYDLQGTMHVGERLMTVGIVRGGHQSVRSSRWWRDGTRFHPLSTMRLRFGLARFAPTKL